MERIRALQDTVLKKEPVQSSQLPDNKLHLVNEGELIHYEEVVGKLDGHIRVKLGWGAGLWWIWPPHFTGLEVSTTTDEVKSVPSAPVQRQIDRLSKYAPKMDLSMGVKYFSQRDNSRGPHRTCNTSSNAMYLDWLIRQTGKPGLKSDEIYLPHVFKYGDTIYHGVQTKAIKDFGFSTKWMVDRDLPFVLDLLEEGFPVVCNILHRGTLRSPRGGHIIVLIDYNPEKEILTAHDPYGTLLSGYSDHNGKNSKIPLDIFKVRWQGGYRTLA